ncbi:HAMP domain-containing sensor histidine kinase, partial [Methylobrevis pamukkalensis]|uniref:HAMP domain-containing sensor histidine kinase n=1 Tax=Methylobrevis pamukkalensis TaxID=1439726 RepID=UPI000ABC841A
MIPFSIRLALRPLATLEAMVKRRDPADLGPLDPPSMPAEIAPLVEALDRFVGRLRETLDRNREFIAEAAHQLRTPLASLRGMAEIALAEKDPDALRDQVARIHRNAAAAARITAQLLADAAVANRLQIGSRVAVRLDRLAAEAVNDAVGFSGDHAIRFDVEEEAEGATVTGDAGALREAVRNLIENAMIHAAAGTSAAAIDVTVARTADGAAAVIVADRGPGILEADKARVMRRFERGSGASEPGSG